MQRGNESGILEKAIYIAAFILIVKLFFLQVLTPGYKQQSKNRLIFSFKKFKKLMLNLLTF